MSFWTRLGVQITDLNCFKESCRKNNVRYIEETNPEAQWQGMRIQARLEDQEGRSHAFLCEYQGGFRVVLDTDAHYSSLTKRLGANGGKLTQSYAIGVAEKQIGLAGGMVIGKENLEDGSVVIRASAGGM